MLRRSLAPWLMLWLALAGCVNTQPRREGGTSELRRETDLGEALCFQCGDLYVAGTLDADALATLGRRGVKAVVDLRVGVLEPSDPLRVQARSLELEYLRLPLEDREIPGDEAVDALLEVLDRLRGRQVLMFCERGTRVAILFAIYRVVGQGVGLDQALGEARQIGMKPGPPEDFVREQVERLGLAL
jgi:uncharacterized protein (TIGR01244 family)